jgi:hypothetical protein
MQIDVTFEGIVWQRHQPGPGRGFWPVRFESAGGICLDGQGLLCFTKDDAAWRDRQIPLPGNQHQTLASLPPFPSAYPRRVASVPCCGATHVHPVLNFDGLSSAA